ncbi:MAG: hypothetical protein QG610_2121 [Euryarchaeota archaeon]|nr:hypothetical protein [Euryarchaeota archaeon]
MKQRSVQIDVSVPVELVEFIDKEKGLVSRSSYIMNLLYRYMQRVQEMQSEQERGKQKFRKEDDLKSPSFPDYGAFQVVHKFQE